MTRKYYRAGAIGEGTYGCVCKAFDEAGNQYAMKVFELDEDDHTLSRESLREISILKLLAIQKAQNKGAQCIIKFLDVFKTSEGSLALIMPLLHINMATALERLMIQKACRLNITYSILKACEFLHKNGIIHRDIKCENILLTDPSCRSAVLIDFSLAKPIGRDGAFGDTQRHTGDIGTAKYIAPEVYTKKPYGYAADCWSAGVCLLEMYTGRLIEATRDKAAFVKIAELKAEIPPDKRFLSSLLKGLLTEDPLKRLTAYEALSLEPIQSKFGFRESDKVLSLLPVPGSQKACEDRSRKQMKRNRKTQSRRSTEVKINSSIKKYFVELDFENNSTLLAADTYWQKVEGSENKSILSKVKPEYCVLLASKLYEGSTYDLDELEEEEVLVDFDKERYLEAEALIFETMDYCLYLENEQLSK